MGGIQRLSHELAVCLKLQLHPAITDLKGPSIFIHYRRISAIAFKRNIEKILSEDWKTAFVIGGFLLLLDPL